MKYLFLNSVAGFGSTGRIAAEKCRELMKEGAFLCHRLWPPKGQL